ncbi:MAG: YdcF family protein [Chitinophagaceae bacterium]|nr:YdcF family protein [Chitinophagaceae bacterium]
MITWFLVHSIYISYDGLKDPGNKADVALILATTVHEDGTLSERLKKRVDCGINLYKTGRVKKIIVSGGFGKEGYYEADKMKEYIIQSGIADSLIIVDNKGDNTRESVKNTLELKTKYAFKDIIVVSQFFHLTRAKMLFRKNGFNDVSSASPNYFEWRDVYSIIREFPAFYLQK